MDKRQVRRDALRARRAINEEQVARLSDRIQDRVLGLPEYDSAKVVASYVAKSDEVQTEKILQSALSSGKRVLVPRTEFDTVALGFFEVKSLSELSPGRFGIREPLKATKEVPLSESQLVIVPIVAWDDSGQRIGYGKGFFDRGLKFKGEATSIGLAFESQHREVLPTSSMDVPLDMVVTERRAIRFGGSTLG